MFYALIVRIVLSYLFFAFIPTKIMISSDRNTPDLLFFGCIFAGVSTYSVFTDDEQTFIDGEYTFIDDGRPSADDE